jgi:hypothetical protein
MAKGLFEGEVLTVGEAEFEGKKYPYFEILQRGVDHSEVVKVSGDGVKVGDRFKGMLKVTVYSGKLRFSRSNEPVPSTPGLMK